MKRLILATCAAIGLLGSSVFGADALDGAWAVTCTPDNAAVEAGAQEFKDAILFHNNELSAEAFAMYGFNTVAYTVPDGTANFTASMTSDTQGSLQWSGQRSGTRVTGTLLWTKPGGQVHRYTFSGGAYQD